MKALLNMRKISVRKEWKMLTKYLKVRFFCIKEWLY